ncbi:hypothetical protein [Spirosoma endbachense]|uniref:Peptidase A2 domain-containing protein n=1 Tax=Spirosoma endbachense TaxID=2666025 RepID=A0A6P1W817_9BACT|nr:hypothetical protein [Spirosoma endbachense]QHW01055.1 hypothetical protein GJR95_41165 [Spirosoma endbachense]
MKKYLFLVLTALITHLSSAQVRSFRKQIDKKKWVPFSWFGDTLGGRRFDKLAIFITGQLGNASTPFNLQFDTGSNVSVLKGNTLESLKQQQANQYAFLPDLSDKTKEGFQSVSLKMLPEGPTLTNVWIDNKYGEAIDSTSLTTKEALPIGSWGADICENRILILDFAKQQIALLDALPEKTQRQIDFVPIEIKNHRPHVPVTINGKQYYLLYDSGASLFPIMTVKKYWDVINPVAVTDTIKRVSTWGKYSDVYGAPMRSEVRLGHTTLTPKVIYYHPDPYKHHEPIFDKAGVIGSVGNSYFLDRIVVIDFKTKHFGLVKE